MRVSSFCRIRSEFVIDERKQEWDAQWTKSLFENLRTNQTIQTLKIEATTICKQLKEFQGIVPCLRENTTLTELTLFVIWVFLFLPVPSLNNPQRIEDFCSVASALEGNVTLKALGLFVILFIFTCIGQELN